MYKIIHEGATNTVGLLTEAHDQHISPWIVLDQHISTISFFLGLL